MKKEKGTGGCFRSSYLPCAASPTPLPVGIPISKRRDEKREIKAKIKRKAHKNKNIDLTIAGVAVLSLVGLVPAAAACTRL